MTKRHNFLVAAIVFAASALGFLSCACAQTAFPASSLALLDMRPGIEKRLTPTSDQVTVARSQNPAARGVLVTIQPGKEAYPGINIKPAGAAWNLSAFGHVEARVVNTGTQPLSIALRVDNSGDWKDNPWDTESVSLEPGQSGTVTTIFGYSYGHKIGYALKPAAVTNVMLFTGKSEQAQSFRVESVTASGPAGEKPPVAPADVRLRPKGGILLGPGMAMDMGTEILSHGAHASLSGAEIGKSLRAVFSADGGDQSVSLRPAVGRWDLRDYLEVRVKVRNAGKMPVMPRARLESNGGVSEWVTASVPLPPGAAIEMTLPFAGAAPADPAHPETGSHLTSDAVSAVTLAAVPHAPGTPAGEQILQVETIRAALPSGPPLPVWLGKRPPVPGAWVKTLDDEFNSTALNQSLWNIYGPNYWDKQTHWSKDDVLVGSGVVRLRYEKKTGFNNDDPAQPKSDYAAGYLHTYDRWTQRYGYFEARLKLPTAPGLWPAFWMMPDRGPAAGPEQWKRQDTGNGGMEFDIMEHLTRWGPHRYNIAMHWDGYGTDHKQIGSDKIYVQPDKDGFLTCGLLWTPGSAVYYCNGHEVLRREDARISNVPSILMFTLPMGGWDNSPLDESRLPDDFVIDYVRVWQRKDLASGLDRIKVALRKLP